MWIRVVIAAQCLLIFFGLRFYLASADYNQWEGLHWNVTHLSQVALFTFISFGMLWLPFLYEIIFDSNQVEDRQVIVQRSALTQLAATQSEVVVF